MKNLVRYILAIALLAGSMWFLAFELRRVRARKNEPVYKKPKTDSIEELQKKRDRIIKRIEDRT